MTIFLNINEIPRKMNIQDIKSLLVWFNKHKSEDRIKGNQIKLLDVLLDRCLCDLANQVPETRNVTVKVVGTYRVTKRVPVYNSKTVMEIFPPNLKAITEGFKADLEQLKELTGVAVSSIEYGNLVFIQILK